MISLNGSPINITKFPDRTSQVWNLAKIDKHTGSAHVEWEFESESEIIHLAQLKALLDKWEVYSTLYIDYLPYARQDKEISNTATFALRPFAKILNSLKFDQVAILDPHSEKSLDLINESSAIYAIEQLTNAIDKTDCTLFCYPDQGAREKYSKYYEYKTIYGEKKRDQATGKITDYRLVGDPAGHNVLIVDDICDGGATFIALAELLKSNGAKEVNLFVTHGLFTKGTTVLYEAGINKIYTKKGLQPFPF